MPLLIQVPYERFKRKVCKKYIELFRSSFQPSRETAPTPAISRISPISFISSTHPVTHEWGCLSAPENVQKKLKPKNVIENGQQSWKLAEISFHPVFTQFSVFRPEIASRSYLIY